ncbi:hypothetical protein LSAT2_024608 [Lamellibrachia satsuma]|nr:hypothetical protein LSAT2_024608 [Lamellibrachia satsuma]
MHDLVALSSRFSSRPGAAVCEPYRDHHLPGHWYTAEPGPVELIPDRRAESVCPKQLDSYYPDRDPYIDMDRVEPTERMTNRRDDKGTTHVPDTGDVNMTLDDLGRDPAFYMTLDTPARDPTSNARMSERRDDFNNSTADDDKGEKGKRKKQSLSSGCFCS